MMRKLLVPVLLGFAFATAGCYRSVGKPEADIAEKPVVRAAVIGGMTMTGLWDEIVQRFEAKTGYRVETIATGQRPILARAMAEGKADLLTMHSGDITTDVVARGYAVHMQPWTHNDLVIIGPLSDPAGIRGMKSGAEAFRKIAETKSNFIDFHSIGPREMSHKLWKMAGVEPVGDWVLKDECGHHLDIANYAAERNAYLVIGRMPILYDKVNSEGMEIMVEGDPAMQRPYIVMEVNPERFPDANVNGARMLADFLVSDEVQELLAEFGVEEYGMPLFHPLKKLQPKLED